MPIFFNNQPDLRDIRGILRYAVLCLSFAAVLEFIPASRAATLFEDDFSDSAFSNENWTYVNEAPDYSGGSAAFGTTASQMVVSTAASNLTSGLTWSMNLVGNDTDPEGDPLVYITMGSGLFGIGAYTSDDDFYYSMVLDYGAGTFDLNKTTSFGVETLAAYTIESAPDHGTVSIDENGSFISFIYTPSDEPTSGDQFHVEMHAYLAAPPGNLYFGIGGTNATYDNVSLQSVPEPSVVGLLAASALALLHRKRQPKRRQDI